MVAKSKCEVCGLPNEGDYTAPSCPMTWWIFSLTVAMSLGDRFCYEQKGGGGRGGQGKVGGFIHGVKKAWPCLGSATERPWLGLGGPISPCRASSFTRLALILIEVLFLHVVGGCG